jgi:uncharacterized protein
VSRDRDPAGRPRNARPRDALGRPLDRSGAGGEARIPDDLTLAGPDAARLADELLRAGRPFHAHEVLEASWKSGPDRERDLWQGLAQVAVGLTHAHRGNARGAVALLSRGAQRVRAYQESSDQDLPYGIDIAAFLAVSDSLAARIERDGLGGIPAAELRPGLRALGKTDSRVRAFGPARAIGAGERRATRAGSLRNASFACTLRTAGS